MGGPMLRRTTRAEMCKRRPDQQPMVLVAGSMAKG